MFSRNDAEPGLIERRPTLHEIQTMRYVVKEKETGRFLASSGIWTKYLGEAQRFPNGLSVNLHLESARNIAPAAKVEIVRLPCT